MKRNALVMSMMLGLSACVSAQSGKPGIPVPFNLKEAGYVTLVIADNTGRRVRNLVSDTWFKAGNNIAYWDGQDDLGRDLNAAAKGEYQIPAKFVAPGKYTVSGLVHAKVNTTYEFTVYATGTPPWDTDDHRGGWLANHTPPQAALFVPAAQSPTHQPAVYLGSYITEGPDGLAWVDLDGKKMGGKKWIGGVWTAAPYLARDAGEKAAAGIYAYVASVWETGKKSGKGELRINALSAKADQSILVSPIGELKEGTDVGISAEIGGFAVHNGIAVVSLPKKNQLVLIDLAAGKVSGTVAVDSPMGLAFDSKGQFLVLSGHRMLRYKFPQRAADIAAPLILSTALEMPVGITLDAVGRIYVSDGGKSHQVKIFTAEGKYINAIGKPGAPAAGPYDRLHMNNPAGMTIDSKQQLWVTERDYLPKRVSVWSLDGHLLKAFYGPSKYGGGGTLDPQDKSKFYYADENKGSMEFKLDWQTGTSKLERIIYRKQPGDMALASRNSGPETPLYYKGRRYFTNCYSSSPTGGIATAFLFVEKNGIAYPAAAMGRTDSWALLKTLNPQKTQTFFIWTDLNGDAKVQSQEVVFQSAAATGGVTVMPDLSFCIASVDGKAMQFSPVGFTAQGIPEYDFKKGVVLVPDVQAPGSSGGNQVLPAGQGLTVITQAMKPFARYSLSGTKDGKAMWSYPNLWPGLHASHKAPIPDFAGELVGPTRLLGGLIGGGSAGTEQLWMINSNHGMVYVFTTDGLFVTTLFKPMRAGDRWKTPDPKRGMSLNDYSLGEENFWPTVTQTTDGEIYLADGARSSLVHVTGLQTISRLAATTVTVNPKELEQRKSMQLKQQAALNVTDSTAVMHVPLLNTPIVTDGKFDDWKKAQWVDIDKGKNAVKGAVAVSGDKLYAGFRTGDPALLKNSGEMALAPFKTGGALDLMVTTAAGNVRLLVTMIKGKPFAMIYKSVVPGTQSADKVPFSSPQRTVTFDRVKDISTQLTFGTDKTGNYEFGIPLGVLNLKPVDGTAVKADIGILKGDGVQTLSRIYWHNKETAIVSDVPSEAELIPALWGKWKFEK